MPTHIFRDDATGETVEQVYPASAIPDSVTVEGKVYKRDVMAEILSQHRHVTPGTPGDAGRRKGWPIWSQSLACHPKQVPQMTERLKRKGVSADFDRHGRPKIESERHADRVAKALGKFKKDSNYSPKNV
jgi:hypothetical protein